MYSSPKYAADKQDVHVAFHGSTDVRTRENSYEVFIAVCRTPQVYSVAPSTDPANATAFEASLLFSLFIAKHKNHTIMFGNVRDAPYICVHISNIGVYACTYKYDIYGFRDQASLRHTAVLYRRERPTTITLAVHIDTSTSVHTSPVRERKRMENECRRKNA